MMLLVYDAHRETIYAVSECSVSQKQEVLGSFCAVTSIAELIDSGILIFAYDKDGSEQWFLRIAYVKTAQIAEELPIAEPRVLINKHEPELYVKVWRSKKIESLRCSFGRAEIEWEFCQPQINSQYEIISETTGVEPLQKTLLPSGVRIHNVQEVFSEIDAEKLLKRSVKGLDSTSEHFIEQAIPKIQALWDSVSEWSCVELDVSSFLSDVEVKSSGKYIRENSINLLHSYGAYGQKIENAQASIEKLSNGKIRELVVPHPRSEINEYAQDLFKVAKDLSFEHPVIGATISAGSVPLILSFFSECSTYSGMIFDRCITANGSLYKSILDNRCILGSLLPSNRLMMQENFAKIEQCLPILTMNAKYDSRIADKDKLRFHSNGRNDLIQLELLGGHTSIPWDVEKIRYLIQILFLESFFN
ncbi:hypothetical protein EML15_07990 [Corynebacterium sp. sy017]|uniref:hypothetical protein n=1 Tax=unclassified Corynebacterium TaxID=2624378 RepID=UPI00118566CA|nr:MULTISPECIES: hypothetical protein [unclassified Corynebacterium]MBP3089083.1 hypothetical protein [Corynebacterium sp. sy017]TSD91398.1 hypothetical protein ELY17_08000 [Corynebacterium sp. SY003]